MNRCHPRSAVCRSSPIAIVARRCSVRRRADLVEYREILRGRGEGRCRRRVLAYLRGSGRAGDHRGDLRLASSQPKPPAPSSRRVPGRICGVDRACPTAPNRADAASAPVAGSRPGASVGLYLPVSSPLASGKNGSMPTPNVWPPDQFASRCPAAAASTRSARRRTGPADERVSQAASASCQPAKFECPM